MDKGLMTAQLRHLLEGLGGHQAAVHLVTGNRLLSCSGIWSKMRSRWRSHRTDINRTDITANTSPGLMANIEKGKAPDGLIAARASQVRQSRWPGGDATMP